MEKSVFAFIEYDAQSAMIAIPFALCTNVFHFRKHLVDYFSFVIGHRV